MISVTCISYGRMISSIFLNWPPTKFSKPLSSSSAEYGAQIPVVDKEQWQMPRLQWPINQNNRICLSSDAEASLQLYIVLEIDALLLSRRGSSPFLDRLTIFLFWHIDDKFLIIYFFSCFVPFDRKPTWTKLKTKEAKSAKVCKFEAWCSHFPIW